MPKIHILPEQLANQIAAGEVVERPASVVKELIENSLDAGATRIEVEIEGGGTRLIRIIDNGCGMDEDDLFLCLERHGTSKIKHETDLTEISTLGFRGEAIPSIGSVSNLSITSRTTESPLGHKIELKYGTLQKSHEAGCAVGTTIEIRNLFGNTPARKKFLRTVRTELNHIDEVIKNYSLTAPDITFILRIDGRETIHFDTSFSLEARLATILRHKDDFLPLKFYPDKEHRIEGLLVSPEKVTPGPAKLRIFVNGRAIKDRMITHGVAEGMRGFLMKGKNPAGLIQLFLPPGEIDVNVHPAKHEIRFRHSREVHSLVTSGVLKAIKAEQSQLQQAIFGDNQPAITPIPESGSATPITERYHEPVAESLPFSDVQTAAIQPQKPIPATTCEPKNQYSTETKIHATPSKPLETKKEDFLEQTTTTSAPYNIPSSQKQDKPEISPKPHLEIMGQVDNLYLFCKTIKGIVVIDQHAAHERLLYEKFKLHFEQNSIVKQNLLFPETVELSLFQTQLVEKHIEDIERMGFSIRDFGGNSYIISAVPALAEQLAPQKIFIDILEQFGSENTRTGGNILDTILATMACKAAVKAGTSLSHKEIANLLDAMAAANLFSHCPHGRPVVKQFNSEEIKKWFYRT